MSKMKKKKERPLLSMTEEEREQAWDNIFIKEQGIIVEFEPDSNTGKVRSLENDVIYSIDSRELVRTRIELRPKDKVFFAPFEDPDGKDYARIISIIELT